MKRLSLLITLIIALVGINSRAEAQLPESSDGLTQVEIVTNKGKLVVELFDDTPLHRQRFLQLVEQGDYEGTLFHRVINLFMIQGGNLMTRDRNKDLDVSVDTMTYTIPQEIMVDQHIHQYGALAAAREGDDTNPTMASSGSQFYIVTGEFFTDLDLDKFEQRYGVKLTDKQRKTYKKYGGTPHLDGKYTVFGQIIEGAKTIERIQSAKTDQTNRPKKDIYIKKIRIIK